MGLEWLYSLDEHRPYDVTKEEGRKRLESQIRHLPTVFELASVTLATHPRVLSIMAGSCIEAIALASHYRVEVTCLDLQKRLLALGAREGRKRKLKLHTIVADARELTRSVRGPFDLITAFGSPLAHFSIFDFDRVAGGIKKVLANDGIFLLDQKDMVFSILLQYPDAMVKNVNPLVVSVHRRFNPSEGYFERLYYGGGKKGTNRVYLWAPWIIEYVLRKNGFSKVETFQYAEPFFMMKSYLVKAQI